MQICHELKSRPCIILLELFRIQVEIPDITIGPLSLRKKQSSYTIEKEDGEIEKKSEFKR